MGRNRRRYGGYIVHLGMLVYFVAFAGMAFKVQREATLKPGESVELKSPFGHTYTFTHVGISQFKQFNRYVSAATIEVARDGVPDGRIVSEKRQHFTVNELGTEEASFEPSTEVGIRSGLQEDIYIVFAGAVNGTEEAVYRFNINPLVWWVWAGGFILAFGGLITMWPGGGTMAAAPAGARRPATAWSSRARGRTADGSPPLPRVPAGFHAQGFRRPALRAGQGAVGTLFNPDVAGRPRTPTLESDNDVVVRNTELKLRCTCGCTLDVFTCRTTDFTCTYSPALHREVVDLFAEGKTSEAVIAAFVDKYGEKILMAPKPEGFNIAGYVVPGAAILAVGGIVAWIIRRRVRLSRDPRRTLTPVPNVPGRAGGYQRRARSA